MRDLEHFIGGKSVPGTSGRVGPVFDPARGIQTAQVPLASAEEVAAAVDVATEAAAEWGAGSLARGRRFSSASATWSHGPRPTWPPPSRPSTGRCAAMRQARWPAGSRTSSSPAGSRTC